MRGDRVRFAVLASVLWGFSVSASCAAPEEKRPAGEREGGISLRVSVDKLRAKAGDDVLITVSVSGKESASLGKIAATLFEPTVGPGETALVFDNEKQVYQGRINLKKDAPSGLYVVTASAGSSEHNAFAKAWFLVGKVICDAFWEPKKYKESYVANYMEKFRGLGGNALLMVGSYSDYDAAEVWLTLADRCGLTVILSVETYIEPYSRRNEELKKMTAEIWQSYRHHPCVAGLYVNHEGSGIYLAPFIKDFCDYAKSLGGNPLTACAPYLEDPNLIGYLTAIDNLDVIELQCQIMGSRRTDNRCVFPMTRCRDHGCLCAGTALLANKIIFSQIEQYANIGEKAVPPPEGSDYSTATKEDIYSQAAGAATAPQQDGFVLSSFSGSIHGKSDQYPKEMKECEEGLRKGIEDYKLINSKVAVQPDPIVFYYPYTDWNVHCWRTSYCPAFGALRRLGVPFGIVSFVPPKGESLLPYYPMNLNEEQLEYLLRNKFVVVIPDLPGMEETDSILLKKFVEKGGTAILFGPHIPYGDRFKRDELCGGTETGEYDPDRRQDRIEVKAALHTRTKEGTVFSFIPKERIVWTPTSGKTVAVFQDGHAAILLNRFGEGTVFTIPVSLTDAVAIMPDLIRDIFDYALAQKGLKRLFDIIGASEDLDIAVSGTDGSLNLALVNHGNQPAEVKVCPLNLPPDRIYVVTDLKTGQTVSEKVGKELSEFQLQVTGRNCTAVSISSR